MSFLDAVMGIIVPHDCLGCGEEGRLLCAGCAGKLRPTEPCCYRCRVPSPGAITCMECQLASPLRQVQAATIYEKTAKALLWKLKSAHAQSAAREMARLMSPLLRRHRRGSLLIMPVPTATTRMRQRGYDQARLLARELSRLAGQPYVDGLARLNQAHQVGASREQRLRQLSAAFRVTRPRRVLGAAILLVDDVVTTGATLEAAALCLRQAGAGPISALVFAQPKFQALTNAATDSTD